MASASTFLACRSLVGTARPLAITWAASWTAADRTVARRLRLVFTSSAATRRPRRGIDDTVHGPGETADASACDRDRRVRPRGARWGDATAAAKHDERRDARPAMQVANAYEGSGAKEARSRLKGGGG